MDGGIDNLHVVILLVDLGAERQGVDVLDVGSIHVFADDLDQVGIALELDVAHVLDGVDVVDDVHIVGSDNLCTVIPVGLVAVVYLRIVRGSDVHTALAAQATDGIAYLGSGARSLKQIDLDAVGAEDVGYRLGKQAAVVAHVMANDNRDLRQIFEILLQIVGKALGSAAHGVDVHAVAASTHDTAQSTGTKLENLVERFHKFGLVLVIEHCLHLGAGFLVITLTEPRLGLGGHFL